MKKEHRIAKREWRRKRREGPNLFFEEERRDLRYREINNPPSDG